MIFWPYFVHSCESRRGKSWFMWPYIVGELKEISVRFCQPWHFSLDIGTFLPKKKSCRRRWSCSSDIDKTTHGPIPSVPSAWGASMLIAPAGNTKVPPWTRTDTVHWNMLFWAMMSLCVALVKLGPYFALAVLQLDWVTRRNVSPLSVDVFVERRKMRKWPKIVITQHHPVSYWPAQSQPN